MSRIENIQKYLANRGLDGIVLPPHTGDVEYVLGNDDLGWREVLLVCKNGRVYRIAEEDLLEQYKKYGEDTTQLLVPGVELVNANGDVAKALSQIATDNGLNKIGVEYHEVRGTLFSVLLGARGVNLVDIGREDTEAFRRVKDAQEIERITMAQRITEAALEELLPYIRPGVTEIELGNRLLAGMISRGATGKSCLLLASGIKTAEVHSLASEKTIEQGDLVQFDIGCIYKGYCSDMSRVVAVGSVTDEQRKTYDLVLKAQEAGIKALRPGVTGKSVHDEAARVFAQAGVDQYFTHGLGHNVGQLIHEAPYSGDGPDDVFEVGHIWTVEPGLYFEGKYGIRVEDMIWLSPDGNVNLTKTTKELRILR